MSTLSGAAPETGATLGIDIGFSPTRRSGAICRLQWDATAFHWTIQRFRYDPDERRAAVRKIAGDRPILIAAFDGPFRCDVAPIDAHRRCERLLTRGIGKLIGKPGAVTAPVGRLLNKATNEAVADVIALTQLGAACHRGAIHERAIVEAFPNSFLGAMLPDGHGLNAGRAGKSDRYYVEACRSGLLARLMAFLLPGRSPAAAFETVVDHDDRAALVCAITALGVAAGAYVAVGDADGRVFLPPRQFWNATVFALLAQSAARDGDGVLDAAP